MHCSATEDLLRLSASLRLLSALAGTNPGMIAHLLAPWISLYPSYAATCTIPRTIRQDPRLKGVLLMINASAKATEELVAFLHVPQALEVG